MQISEKNKYIRELKKTLNIMLQYPSSVAQVHAIGNIIIVDIRVKHHNLKEYQRIDLTYHDCFAMPTEFSYGCAKVQASLIKDCYNSFLDSVIMS